MNADTCYITTYILQHLAFITEPSLGKLLFLGKVKRPKTVPPYRFMCAQHINHNIEKIFAIDFISMYIPSLNLYAGRVLGCFTSPDNTISLTMVQLEKKRVGECMT
jgi:hypothetical protein